MCLCDRANSPARGPRARAGPGPQILNCFAGRAGPGHTVAGRAGPGPHNSICGPGPGRAFTTAAGLGRAWASNHICGPGLGLDFRPVQDTTIYHGSKQAVNSPKSAGIVVVPLDVNIRSTQPRVTQ